MIQDVCVGLIQLLPSGTEKCGLTFVFKFLLTCPSCCRGMDAQVKPNTRAASRFLFQNSALWDPLKCEGELGRMSETGVTVYIGRISELPMILTRVVSYQVLYSNWH